MMPCLMISAKPWFELRAVSEGCRHQVTTGRADEMRRRDSCRRKCQSPFCADECPPARAAWSEPAHTQFRDGKSPQRNDEIPPPATEPAAEAVSRRAIWRAALREQLGGLARRDCHERGLKRRRSQTTRDCLTKKVTTVFVRDDQAPRSLHELAILDPRVSRRPAPTTTS